jgi:hypothetical protein
VAECSGQCDTAERGGRRRVAGWQLSPAVVAAPEGRVRGCWGRWPSQTLKEVGPGSGRRHSGVARRWGRRRSRGWPAGGVRGGGVPESEPEAEEAWPRERMTDCVVTWQQF